MEKQMEEETNLRQGAHEELPVVLMDHVPLGCHRDLHKLRRERR